MLGYAGLLVKKLHIHVAFTPAIFCAGVSSVLFAAGILNLLPLAASLLFAVGVVLFALHVKDALKAAVSGGDLRAAARSSGSVFFIVYIITLLLFCFHMKGAHYTHYDNFSHWALVIREMLLVDRMPCYKESLILFQSYPLGSALYIYYVCKILGSSEACYLFAQTMMSVSFIFSLSAFVKKNWQSSVLILLFGIYALISNITIYNLLVDTVMPLAAVAAVCLILYENAADRKTILALAPLMIFLVQVKNSGLFFAAACWCIWLRKNFPAVRSDRRLLLTFLLYDVALPLASYLVWQKHIGLVFDNALETAHAVSISYYADQFSGKSRDTIGQIGSLLLAQLFDLDGAPLTIMALVSMIFAILICSSKEPKARKILAAALAEIWIIFAAYILGIFAMYIFSMPGSDFTSLPSFYRYMNSCLLFLYGIAAVYMLIYMPGLNRLISALLVVLCLLPVYGCRSTLNTLITRQDYQSTKRYRFVSLLEDHHVERTLYYAFYQPDAFDDYLDILSLYELRSRHCDWFPCDISYDELKKNYNYLIILEQDEKIQSWLAANGLTEYISDEPAVIELTPSQP